MVLHRHYSMILPLATRSYVRSYGSEIERASASIKAKARARAPDRPTISKECV